VAGQQAHRLRQECRDKYIQAFTLNFLLCEMQCSGSSDPYPDFTDLGPDSTHLVIVNKKNLLQHHITNK
jgi:hypothetical protein